MVAIAIEGLTRRFGHVVAVDDVSFTVQPGRVTAFLGPNGSGKTTTLRMLLGLTEPTSGEALIGGRRYDDLEQPFHTVGVLLDGGFHPGRRARDHLRILATSSGVGKDRIDATLEFCELGDVADRRVGGFSTGMKQRLGLAAALLTDPPVLILDEPLNGLDPEGVLWLRRLLRTMADEGRTVLLSSHVLAETEQIADDIVIISQGRLRAAASMKELADRLTPEVSVCTPQSDEARAALAAAGFAITAGTSPDRFNVAASSGEVGELLGRAGVRLHELIPQERRLESLYFQLVGVPPRSPGTSFPPPAAGTAWAPSSQEPA